MPRRNSRLQSIAPVPIDDEESPLLGNDNTQNAPKHRPGERVEDYDEDDVRFLIGWTPQAGWFGLLRGVVLALCIAILTFCEAINMSIITTIQSALAEEYDCYENTTWLVASYMIATALMSPLAGRLSSIFTPKYAALYFTILFTAGTAVISIAKTFVVFLVGRAIQGIGSGGILTVTIIVVLEFTKNTRKGFNIGLINTGFTAGVSLGGIIGGAALQSKYGWRGAFYFQIPFSLLAGILACVCIPTRKSLFEDEDEDSWSGWIHLKFQELADIDYAGILTLTPFLISILLALSIPSLQLRYLLPIAIVSLLLFLLIESRTAADRAIIPIKLITSRVVILTSFSTLLLMCARWMLLFYTPIYSTVLLSFSPTSAGASLIPASIGFALGSILMGLAMPFLRTFYVTTIFTLLIFIGTWTGLKFLVTEEEKALSWLIVLSVGNGIATGATLNLSLAHLLQSLPASSGSQKGHTSSDAQIAKLSDNDRTNARIVTGVYNTFRTFAGSLGASVGGGVFVRTLNAELSRRDLPQELIRRIIGSPALVNRLGEDERMIAKDAYRIAVSRVIIVAMGLGLASVVTLIATYKRDVGRRPSAWRA